MIARNEAQLFVAACPTINLRKVISVNQITQMRGIGNYGTPSTPATTSVPR
jgi:hypothetical protein